MATQNKNFVPSSTPFCVAYVLLWFPLSSETFIYREIRELMYLGLRIRIYTMYGESLKGCSKQMRAFPGKVSRMGIKSFFAVLGAFIRAFRKRPRFVFSLMRQGLFRKMRNIEALGENCWCFFAGFLLAEKCLEDGVDLIHAAWANGPATAAWIASRLSGIPYAFTGRAGDIYPEDGLLAEKSADAVFVRTNNAANVGWLQKFCPPGDEGKVKLVYNNLTCKKTKQQPCPIEPPYRILAIGRFVRTKGFPQLLTAMARLRREGLQVTLTLVGDGSWWRKISNLRKRLHLEDCVEMPGFVPHDEISRLMEKSHILVVPSVVHKNGDRDGIPNVIMEALNCAKPVVATDVCGISEIIRDGETGYLVPQRDPAALADAVRKMLTDAEKARQMALAGKKLVCEIFDTQKNTQTLANLYYSAVKGSANG